MSFRARIVAALVAITLVATGVATSAPPAAAEGPAEIVLTGHGFGHGRGLGQYGAKGYAEDHGWSTAQILNHFYGGTTAGSRPDQALRVLLCDLEGVTICTGGPGVTQIVVTSTAAFTVEAPHLAPFPAGAAVRLTREGNLWQLASAPSGGCGATTFAPIGDGTGDPVLDIDPTTAFLQVCAPKARTYRGTLKFAVEASSGKPRVVNFVGAEEYLKGVVPNEMPASWHAEALKAQAVAARSYVLAGDNRFPGFADTCDTIQCQVYRGVGNEQASTNAAIDATAGQVRMKAGAVARTEFSSSTGGYTAGGTFPAVVDEGDDTAANPNHTWTVTLPASQIEQAYPTIGDLQRIEILERNGLGAEGGRVTSMRVVGAASNVTVTGNGFRQILGLKSDWFTPAPHVVLQRLAAADRYATAAAIARATFASSDVAVLVRGDGADSFPDGLAANYLAGHWSAPTLLATSTSVPAVTLDVLQDLGVEQVRLLGGTSALSTGVETALTNAGFTVTRTGGADRYATAADVARAVAATEIGTVGGKRTAILASGQSFPDALAAGAVVAASHLPLLLAETGRLPETTAAALTDLGIQHVLVVGGPAALAAGVESAVQGKGITTERIAGANRYDTAVRLADHVLDRFGYSLAHLDVATGERFPDALTGGVHAGRTRSPLLLTAGTGVPAELCALLQRRGAAVRTGHVFGGAAAVDDVTKAALETCTRS